MDGMSKSESFITLKPEEVREIIKPADPSKISVIQRVIRARWTTGTGHEDQIKELRQNPRILITNETRLTPRIDGAKGWEILFKVRNAEVLPT